MSVAVLVGRLVLAGVFAVAGVAKLRDLPGSRDAVESFGVPAGLAPAFGLLLPAAELLIACALIPLASARYGALGGFILLSAFALAIGNALAHGRAPDCHCFGQLHSEPAGPRTLARNGVLAALAAFVAVGGWDGAGLSATHWVTTLSTGEVVGGAAVVLVLALIALQAWFSLQLLAQNGRLVGRLDSLEQKVAALADPAGVEPEPLAAGLTGAGLSVGTRAPEFSLPGLHGETVTLSSLRAAGRRVLLVFTSPSCGPCDALAPTLAKWQNENEQELTIAVISTGERDEVLSKASAHGLQRVLIQPDREVSSEYQAHGTPMAVVVSPAGLIESPAVGGGPAIEELVQRVLKAPAATNGVAVARPRTPPRRPRADRVQLAPPLTLPDLDGTDVAMSDLYRDRTVVLFWNPGCGFCQKMLPRLKELEQDPPAGTPNVVVVSTGDTDRNRAQRLRSPVLMDADGEAKRAFGTAGTPTAVLVERGRIVSDVARGADAVIGLFGHGGAELEVIPATDGSSPKKPVRM